MKLLLISCSSSKLNTTRLTQAKEMYTGALFKHGFIIAKQFGYKPLVLSAKYGFIKPEQLIHPYNEKLKIAYSGDWPDGDGYYLGGPLYFKNAPERFKALIPSARYGEMCYYANLLEAGTSRAAIFERASRPKPIGIVKSIYYMLLDKPHTKEELYLELIKTYGETPSIKKTIQAQVGSRIAKEKRCIIHRNQDKYWLTTNIDFYTKKPFALQGQGGCLQLANGQ